MSLRLSYVGDPLSALGYALVGARRFSPECDAAAVASALDEARADSDLVMIESAYAKLVETQLRNLAITAPLPPVVVVPGLHDDETLSGRGVREARIVLGIG